ncbi:hypothetical protein DER45DRAFT_46878 [Fusarium avenaceum]|nr:hypothetical protein DER45DRAFT_46878 [Fusarium avenaceum]
MTRSSPIAGGSSPFEAPSPDFAAGSPIITSPRSPIFIYHDWKAYKHQIPILPQQRPRALTPAGFRDGDTEDVDRPAAKFQNSPWFKLPANVRQDILRLAFGDERVHMCLGFNMNDALDNDSKVWSWCGCICNRKMVKSLGPMTRGSNTGPWVDRCFNHDQGSYFGGESKTKNIGVVGWLQSCRQNYAETIDILYSTNTIILSGDATILHLEELVERQRLDVVTSLEVKCSLKADSDVLKEILTKLTPQGLFPNLKRLYVSVEIGLHQQRLAPALKLVDQFVGDRPNLDECAFALPMEWFGKINRSLHDDRTGQQISYNQIWRSLDDCENKMESGVDKSAYTEFDCVHLPYVDSYPKPPYHLENSSSGYWILEAGQLPLNWELDNNLTLNGGYTGTDQWPF